MNHIVKLLLSLCLVSFLQGCATDEDRMANYMEKANTLFEEGNYTKAILEYKNALQIDPAHVNAHLQLGEAYLKQDDPKNAFHSFSRANSLDPANNQAKVKLASFYFLMKQLDKTNELILSVLKQEPLNIDALMIQSGLMLEDKQIEEAQFALERIIRLDEKETRPFLTLAQIYSAQGKVDEAEHTIKQGIERDSGKMPLQIALIKLYEGTKQTGKAEKHLDTLLASHPDDAQLFLEQGYFLFRQKRFDEAETAFRKAQEIAPDEKNVLIALTGFYDSLGKKDETLAMYKLAHEKLPEDINIMASLAKQGIKYQEFDLASEFITKVLAIEPQNKDIRLLDIQRLIASNDHEQAIAQADTLLREVPASFAEANHMKAVAYLGLGQIQSAINTLNETIEARPDVTNARRLLVKIYLQSKQFDQAKKASNEALQQQPDNIEFLNSLGTSAFALRDFASAKDAFNAIITKQPANPDAYFQLGMTQVNLDQHDQAAGSFEKALEINPQRVDILQKQAMHYLSTQQPEIALHLCDVHLRKVKENPDATAKVLLLKGRIYITQKDWENAEIAYEQAIKQAPDLQEAYFSLAQLYVQRDGLDEAIALLKQAIKENPQQAVPHLLLANIYDVNQHYSQSEPLYRKVLSVNPEFIPAANNLAYVLAEQGKDLEDALQLALTAQKKLPDNIQVLDTLGWIQTKMGAHDKAIDSLKQSLELSPDHPSITYHLGMAYLNKGDKQNARLAFERSLKSENAFPEKEEVKTQLEKL